MAIDPKRLALWRWGKRFETLQAMIIRAVDTLLVDFCWLTCYFSIVVQPNNVVVGRTHGGMLHYEHKVFTFPDNYNSVSSAQTTCFSRGKESCKQNMSLFSASFGQNTELRRFLLETFGNIPTLDDQKKDVLWLHLKLPGQTHRRAFAQRRSVGMLLMLLAFATGMLLEMLSVEDLLADVSCYSLRTSLVTLVFFKSFMLAPTGIEIVSWLSLKRWPEEKISLFVLSVIWTESSTEEVSCLLFWVECDRSRLQVKLWNIILHSRFEVQSLLKHSQRTPNSTHKYSMDFNDSVVCRSPLKPPFVFFFFSNVGVSRSFKAAVVNDAEVFQGATESLRGSRAKLYHGPPLEFSATDLLHWTRRAQSGTAQELTVE